MEEIIKQLGDKIDAFKNETVTKAELIELMSQVKALETAGENVTALKSNVDEIALRVLGLEEKGVPSNTPKNLSSLLA